MSEVSGSPMPGPLQSYGVLLGRSIKIIECEVDPDAAACITKDKSNHKKTEKLKPLKHKIASSDREHEQHQGSELEGNSFESIKRSSPGNKNDIDAEGVTDTATANTQNSDDDKIVSDSLETAEYTNNAQLLQNNSQFSNMTDSIAGAAACCSTTDISENNGQEQPENVTTDIVDKEPQPLNDVQLLVKSEPTPNDDVQLDSAMPSNDEAEQVDRLDGDMLPNIEDQQVEFVSVSHKIAITDYSQEEWKGETYTAECMRAGYARIISDTHCTYMRRIRGDNYCGLRATSFQCLSQNLRIFSNIDENIDHFVSIPQRLLKDHNCDWLLEWTFAERIPFTTESKLSVMKDCLSYLVEQVKISRSLPDDDARDGHFSAIFNSGTNKEIYLFEALKLLMIYEAVKLHEQDRSGEEVPIFAWLLFARDTSDSPKNLMFNHLNSVGQNGGLEQVNMYI